MAISTFGTFQIHSIRVYRYEHDGLGDITNLVISYCIIKCIEQNSNCRDSLYPGNVD